MMARDNREAMPALDVLFYPSLPPDIFSKFFGECSEIHFLNEDEIMWFANQYSKSVDSLINPYFSSLVAKDFSVSPPAIVITGEYDPLSDPAETFVKKLRRAGANAVGIRASGIIHGFAAGFKISYAAKNIVKMIYSIIPDMMREQN